jgi:hypothetical protein
MAGQEERNHMNSISYHQPVISIPISDIVRETDAAYWVRVKRTGKLAYLSKKFTQFDRGRAIVPEWLGRKIEEVMNV